MSNAWLLYFRGLPSQARAVLGTALLILVLLLLTAFSFVVGFVSERTQRIGQLEPQIARMLGYEESGATLAESLATAEEQLGLLIYGSELDAAGLGAIVQQVVRGAAERTGLTVSGSQLLGAQPEGGLDVVRVALELRGSVASLDEFLSELEVATPLLVVESFRILGPRQRRGEPEDVVSISTRILAFRLREPE